MGFLMETDYQIRKLRPWSHHPRELLQGRGSTALGYRSKVRGPLLKGRKTRLTDGFPVARLVLLQQPVADQKHDAACANFDGRDHDNAP